MYKHTKKFETITKTAKEPMASWNNSDLLRFHFFNPNGLMGQKRALDAKIDQAHSEGRCMGGAVFAYGSLNRYSFDRMLGMLELQRVSSIDLSVTLKMLKEDIKRAEEFLAEIQSV